MQVKLYLASTSKFKSSILNRVGLKHQTMSSNIEEKSSFKDPYEYVKDLSLNKALSIKDKITDGFIIGLDTIVLINNKIIEKPLNIKEARLNLENSSNNLNKVITGITIINTSNNKIITDYQETLVTFKAISKEDIDYYLENEPDIMYASGFIIENIASNFISKIEGSYYNILGAPVEKIYEILNKFNVYLKDISH